MPGIRAGELHRRITLQTRSVVVDTFGGQSTTWIDLTTVWANIQSLTDRELMASQAVQSSVTHEITIRYQVQFADPKVVAAMRATLLKDGVTRIFNIHGARDDGERRELLILSAEEGLNNG